MYVIKEKTRGGKYICACDICGELYITPPEIPFVCRKCGKVHEDNRPKEKANAKG